MNRYKSTRETGRFHAFSRSTRNLHGTVYSDSPSRPTCAHVIDRLDSTVLCSAACPYGVRGARVGAPRGSQASIGNDATQHTANRQSPNPDAKGKASHTVHSWRRRSSCAVSSSSDIPRHARGPQGYAHLFGAQRPRKVSTLRTSLGAAAKTGTPVAKIASTISRLGVSRWWLRCTASETPVGGGAPISL